MITTSSLPDAGNTLNAGNWEIRRRSTSLGIKMTGDGFQSDSAAKFAGRQVLADFLTDLSKEEKLRRK
jgi:hypothetical protein